MAKRLESITDEMWAEMPIHKTNKKIADEFLKQKHLSPDTLKQYKSAIRQFFRWIMDEHDNKPLFKFKKRIALDYQNYLYEVGLAPNSIKFKRSVVSSMCGYVETYVAEDDENFENFRNIYSKQIPNPPKSLVREKQPLTKEEFDLLVEALESQEKWQMLAYVHFTYASGCRRSEALQLRKEVVGYSKVKDGEGKEKQYYMTHTIRCKGRGQEGKVRKLQFNDTAKEAVGKWLKERAKWEGTTDDCEYVFVKRVKDKETGKYAVSQLSRDVFNYWCSDIFSKIVGRRVHPHMFRSTRATHMSLEGKDIKVAQKLLGHESSETTQLYVIREDDDVLDGAFE